jgi:hypothetical protein
MKQAIKVSQRKIIETIEVFFDKATKEKIQKHISDFNDVITEDDIKNAKTDMTILPLTASAEPKISKSNIGQ